MDVARRRESACIISIRTSDTRAARRNKMPKIRMQELPPEFDSVLYRATYNDLSKLSEKGAEAHFRTYGTNEGRIGSSIATRAKFLQLLSEADSVLEIGPMAAPVARGAHVRYFDVLPTSELKAKAAAHGMSAENCPDIHYVSETGDLSVIPDTFEAAVSSHAIEHQPDLLAHLRRVARVLLPGGRYFLMIPDKRYCFDHFIPESSIARVIDANVRGKRLHDVGNIIEQFALKTHNDPSRHWHGDHGEPRLKSTPIAILDALDHYRRHPGKYLDTHAWQFVPESFREIVQLLFDLGMIPLRPERIYPTVFGSNEFYAVLENVGINPAALRTPLPDDFDDEAYLDANPDVRAAGVDPRLHFVQYGIHEKRKLRP